MTDDGRPASLTIAQVTPFPWESRREVNEYVERLSHELAQRDHRVLVLAPSSSRTLVRDSRRLIRAACSQREEGDHPGGGPPLRHGSYSEAAPSAARQRTSISRRTDWYSGCGAMRDTRLSRSDQNG